MEELKIWEGAFILFQQGAAVEFPIRQPASGLTDGSKT